MIELCIITGVSGAGKSTIIYSFEEMGYFISENIPLPLINNLLDLFEKEPKKYPKCAISVPLSDSLDVYHAALEHPIFHISFLGLDCSSASLIERYKLTRHVHPLQGLGYSLVDALKHDSDLMLKVRGELTNYIDTSKLSGSELRKYVYDNILNSHDKMLVVNFSSFGFKKMIPQDLDMIFDTRMIPNPFWVPELKELTGLDEAVQKYVLDSPITKEYLKHVIEYLDFYLARLNEEGRSSVMIGIGCSGGQHRSVVIADYLRNHYSKQFYTVSIHRDIPR